MQNYGEDDYLIFDCPGQIELYNHLSVFKTFVDFLKQCFLYASHSVMLHSSDNIREDLKEQDEIKAKETH
eukprot:1157797-Pelagomonas_calceolata.AAC.4